MSENKKGGFFQEFKEFISRGNVMDLAVGVIIGTAFTAIVNSLVNDILMPFIALITGGFDFSDMYITVGESDIMYGNFIGAVINFVLIALVIFILVRTINRMRRKEEVTVTTYKCPYCRMEVDKEATKCPHCTSDIVVEVATTKG